ncbi:DUF7698 family protein [Auritidibacter ignavus]|uniref:DUF7698 family protein n=1 Tax=Auritidibacter ignavus TaxID=678932 RepID=UPI00244B4452|nr:hypothetical protein [Auritidibacter ignavus]WGH86851.1 hypothetical protein QDX24_03325 [Auritidibacter ignavus]WGH89135.1 hypothetical protein QDX22_03320 [Auritidibacter ignavus]
MRTIGALDEQIETRQEKNLMAIVSGYKDTLEAGNELVDLAREVFDHEVPTLLDELRELEITEFTISAPQTNTTTIIWQLVERRARLNGLIQVKSRSTNWTTGQQDLLPAWHLSVNQRRLVTF